MTDYAAFCPVVNRPDLLKNLVDSVEPLWENFTIIDNSPDRWATDNEYAWHSVSVFTPPVPLSFSQSMNWELEETLRRYVVLDFARDVRVVPAALGQSAGLVGAAALLFAADRYWGAE